MHWIVLFSVCRADFMSISTFMDNPLRKEVFAFFAVFCTEAPWYCHVFFHIFWTILLQKKESLRPCCSFVYPCEAINTIKDIALFVPESWMDSIQLLKGTNLFWSALQFQSIVHKQFCSLEILFYQIESKSICTVFVNRKYFHLFFVQ